MNAAVICPGPSVRRTWPGRAGYDFVTGVNRAVHLAACDLWTFLDEGPASQLPLRYMTTEQNHRILSGVGRIPPAVSVMEVERQFDRVPHDLGGASWCTFSSTAALIGCYLEGAKSIDVFGYDATSAPDFDGVSLPTNNRDRERWEHEAVVWHKVTEWLAERGCEVRRIRPDANHGEAR